MDFTYTKSYSCSRDEILETHEFLRKAFHICGDFVGRLIESELIFFLASKFVSVSFIISFLLPPLPIDTFYIVNSYSFLFLFHFGTLFESLVRSEWINKLYFLLSPFSSAPLPTTFIIFTTVCGLSPVKYENRPNTRMSVRLTFDLRACYRQ